MISSAVAFLTLSPIASSICEGFAVPAITQHSPGQPFRRSLPTLYYQEVDNTIAVATPPTKELVAALLGGEVVPLFGADAEIDFDFTTHEHHSVSVNDIAINDDDNEYEVDTPPQPSTSLRPLSFDDDIGDFLDIARPYYALANEHAIVDDNTGETTGFFCTGRVEIPSGCENSDIPWADAVRQMAAAGTVAAMLNNPQKKRFYYPASEYHCDVRPNTGRVKKEVAKLLGSTSSTNIANDPIILVRCTDFSKRTAKCQIFLEHGDAIWELNIDYYVIAEPVFEKMHPASARQGIHKSSSSTQTSISISYESLRKLNDIRSFSDITGEWLTMEAIMPPCKASDCQGHFQSNPALPHSFMIIPNMDLAGKAISQFTGVSLNKYGIEVLSWTALPETLHFPDTCGLKYQCKVFLSKGELGEFGSAYYVETVVKKETGESCYKATGEVVLQPKKVPRPDSNLLLPAHVESLGSV